MMASTSRSQRHQDTVVVADLSNNVEPYPIKVINNVDDQIPQPFQYNIRNMLCDDVIQKTQGLHAKKFFCFCDPGTGCVPGTCGCENASTIVFDPKSRIVAHTINAASYNDLQYVECGLHCSCKGNCKRQLSRDTVMKKVEVHYKQDLGFSVIAKQHIAAGMPIVNYVGYVITDEYHQKNRTDAALKTDYMFNIFHQGSLVVHNDAANYGNVSRFINHSCDPNTYLLQAFPYIFKSGTKQMSIPKLVIVAARNIVPNDEITISYGSAYFHDRNIPCLCYTSVCLVPPENYKAKADTKQETEAARDKRRKLIFQNAYKIVDVAEEVIEISD